ncbi:MAG: CHASE2 domain-containing protein, partial [Spirochaeta sp.]|nr:CHASE2 domain-containing protein [Spirochaeta sp.]
MLINWPKKGFLESFRHMTYYELILNSRLEKNLIHNLKIMESYGFLHYYQGQGRLLEPYLYAENLKQVVMDGGSTAAMGDYLGARGYFFEVVDVFLNSEAEAEILAEIEVILSMEDVTEETKDSYREIKEMALDIFTPTKALIKSLAESRSKLKESLAGAFCIIGHTGTSTTDIGVNPFEKEYMNVGTHASLVNTILSGRFLDEYPWWYSAVIALVLAFSVTLVIRGLKPLPSILVGMAFVVLLSAAQVGFFLITGIYLHLLTPLLAVFFTFIALTLFKFLILEEEKSFLRNAFSHYLSTDVINELISDPDKLNLGGEKKVLTAFFTDVQGFSTISEKLDPTDLVKLLNAYLTEMSDIIMDLRGTIDKYEGDAIISFFGAPIEYGSHARNACLAAVRMKKMESRLNEHFLKESLSPSALLTRMGINTGEMVVGNMGTAKKMDYTIMGNSVNLAARLEGVNKQYGTWVMISEATSQAAGDGFTVRKLDRVRVVGIQEPVRLFELIDEKGSTEAKTKEALQIFQTGLDLFE